MSIYAKFVVALLAGGAALLSAAASAAPPGGPCSTHASLLQQACFADRKDDYLVHRADCAYVVSEDDENDCRNEAKEERAEKAEECDDVYEARMELCELVGEQRYEFNPGITVDPDEIGATVDPNPYWPLTAGHTHVIVAEGEVTVVTATSETLSFGGLNCRVIRDLVFEEDDGEYIPAEVTQDWYAQKQDTDMVGSAGDTIYCGENTYEITTEIDDDGDAALIDNTDGSFANGVDRAQAGFLVRADPEAIPGISMGDRQEMATDEAEDYTRYESLSAIPTVPEGGDSIISCDPGCLKTFEVNPRDPGEGEFKYYLSGTGFVLATKLELNDDGEFEPTGEREEVSCVHTSLQAALDDSMNCGIGDSDAAEALGDALCEWAPALDICD